MSKVGTCVSLDSSLLKSPSHSENVKLFCSFDCAKTQGNFIMEARGALYYVNMGRRKRRENLRVDPGEEIFPWKFQNWQNLRVVPGEEIFPWKFQNCW